MRKLFFSLVLLSVIGVVRAQDLTISFTPKASNAPIDSIHATNLRTNKKVKLLSDSQLLLVKNLTGTDLLSVRDNLLQVYPNPVDNEAVVSFMSETKQQVEISLFGSSGELLAKKIQNVEQGEQRFGLKFPAAGIYHVSVQRNGGQTGHKIVYTGNTTQLASVFYQGSQSVANESTGAFKLKSAVVGIELEFAKGDIILYSFYSSKNTTILADQPSSSKTIEVEFVACVDKDNRNYKAVKIGSQWWMAENLAYLPTVSMPKLGSDSEPLCYVYDYSGTNVAEAKATNNYKTYGVLYNWSAAKSFCPAGWHLPSDDEWKQLEMALGMTKEQADAIDWRGTDQGKQMKSTIGWNNKTGITGTNASGFTALPAGYRYSDGSFRFIESEGCWWSSTDFNTNEPWYHYLTNWNNQVRRMHNYNLRTYAWSVRYVKD